MPLAPARRTLLLLACLLSVLGSTHGVRAGHRQPLPFDHDLHTFRGEGGRTAVLAVFAVTAGALNEEAVPRGTRFRFDVSVVLADTLRRTVARADDSVFVAFRGRPDAEHLLYTQVDLLAEPSDDIVRRVIMTDATTPGIGQLYEAPFPIPDYRGSHLQLSDVVLGLPDVRGGWSRGAASLAPLPSNRMPSSAFELYYEIYNLGGSRRYSTDIALESMVEHRHVSKRLEPVHLRFSDIARPQRDGTVAEQRRVETSLPRGCYRLTVTVTDELTGSSATRARHFDVRGWGRGTTLVRALPRPRSR